MASATDDQVRARRRLRLPRTRESRPIMLGLAILLIVGGALASAWLACRPGTVSYFISVNREVNQGARDHHATT